MAMLIMLCLAGGSLVGLLNGMLGMGGTFIVIPLLDEVMARMGLSPAISHVMAVGTAPSTILFTCLSSWIAHTEHGSVRKDLLRRMGGGIFAGSMAGAFLAPLAPVGVLKTLFACILLLMGLYLLFPLPRKERKQENLRGLEGAGVFFGLIASMSGLAGTLLCLTFLNWRGVPWRECVGTSSGIGFIIAVTSTGGYVLSGLSADGLPSWSFGYVYLPGTLCLVLPAVIMARAGAFLANWKRLPTGIMKKGVGVLNILMAVHVLTAVW